MYHSNNQAAGIILIFGQLVKPHLAVTWWFIKQDALSSLKCNGKLTWICKELLFTLTANTPQSKEFCCTGKCIIMALHISILTQQSLTLQCIQSNSWFFSNLHLSATQSLHHNNLALLSYILLCTNNYIMFPIRSSPLQQSIESLYNIVFLVKLTTCSVCNWELLWQLKYKLESMLFGIPSWPSEPLNEQEQSSNQI